MYLPSPAAVAATLLLVLVQGAEAARAKAERSDLSKILGGTDAKNKEFPYLLSLELWGHHICGATSLNTWWAVTAAHCITEVGPEDLVGLRAGSVRRELGGHVHCVVRIVKHPRYGDHWYDHDIALLQVAKPFPADSYVSFPEVSDVLDWPPGTQATVAGWGVTRLIHNLLPISCTFWNAAMSGYNTVVNACTSDQLEHRKRHTDGADISFSGRLKKVSVQVVGNEVCRKKPVFFMIYPVTSRMMCAISSGKDSTQGDSGGPLVVQQDNATSLVGIVSWGEGRGHVDSPGVYTRVASFAKWILNHIKKRRPARSKDAMRLLTCGASRSLWGDYSTHKVHVIPARKRRGGRRRQRAGRPATSSPRSPAGQTAV